MAAKSLPWAMRARSGHPCEPGGRGSTFVFSGAGGIRCGTHVEAGCGSIDRRGTRTAAAICSTGRTTWASTDRPHRTSGSRAARCVPSRWRLCRAEASNRARSGGSRPGSPRFEFGGARWRRLSHGTEMGSRRQGARAASLCGVQRR